MKYADSEVETGKHKDSWANNEYEMTPVTTRSSETQQLRRSLRSNAMFPTADNNPLSSSKRVKKKHSRHTTSLASSTYVRNVDAFSLIKTDIASGASK